MNLDPGYLFLSLMVSAIGFGAFLYGKSRPDPKALVIGIVLMVVTYFVTNTLALLGVSSVLIGLLFSEPIVARLEGRGAKTRRIQSIHD